MNLRDEGAHRQPWTNCTLLHAFENGDAYPSDDVDRPVLLQQTQYVQVDRDTFYAEAYGLVVHTLQATAVEKWKQEQLPDKQQPDEPAADPKTGNIVSAVLQILDTPDQTANQSRISGYIHGRLTNDEHRGWMRRVQANSTQCSQVSIASRTT